MSKKEYLLDTSIVRSLKFEEVTTLKKRKGFVKFTASYVLPMEILAGTLPFDAPKSEDENRKRLAALRKYYELIGVNYTNWEDPLVIIARAFGIQRQGLEKFFLWQLIKDCLAAKNLAEVQKYSSEARIVFGQLRQNDEYHINIFLDGLGRIEGRNQLDNTFLESSYLKTIILLAFGVIIGVVPKTIFEAETVEELKAAEEVLLPKYDGSLDLLIGLWFEYIKEIRTKQRSIGKKTGNDAFDLAHITSLQVANKNQIFVTEESHWLRLFKMVAPERILNKADFLIQNRVT
jgi:hypothetical protein